MGTFIVFDGLPGSGKGTQIKRTFDYTEIDSMSKILLR